MMALLYSLDRSKIIFTGVVQSLQRRWDCIGTIGQKAVASSRTRARAIHNFGMLWDPAGPVRISPLLAL